MEERKYAGFWIRFAAAIIDSIIFMVAFGILIYGLFSAGFIQTDLGDNTDLQKPENVVGELAEDFNFTERNHRCFSSFDKIICKSFN